MRKYLCVFLIMSSLIACSANDVKNNTYFQLTVAIEESVKHEQWDQASKQAQSLIIYFEQNQWRLKKLIKEDQIIRLNEELNKLRASIEERDMTKTNGHLSVIKKYTEELFLNQTD